MVKKFEEVTSVKIIEGYGLSEASPVTHTTSPYLTRKIGSVGPPIPNTLEAIIDPDTGEFLPPGKAGELLVSGPQVMKGYWQRPEETADVFLSVESRKWLRTGDMGVLDADGYLTIVDRSKDLIKYKGHSVYPSEVEEALYQHPAVSQAAVIGVPDPVAGETIKAFVVLREEFRGKSERRGDHLLDPGEVGGLQVPPVPGIPPGDSEERGRENSTAGAAGRRNEEETLRAGRKYGGAMKGEER